MRHLLPESFWRARPTSANHPPSIALHSSGNATTTRATFTLVGRDVDGQDDIYRLYFLVNSSPRTEPNSCHGFYDRISNAIYLYNDALTVAMGPITPGSGDVLQNGQCSVQGSSSSVVAGSGTDFTMRIGIELKGAFASRQKVYAWAKDSGRLDSGWVETATWRIQ
jgi:hypothetical protein